MVCLFVCERSLLTTVREIFGGDYKCAATSEVSCYMTFPGKRQWQFELGWWSEDGNR